MPVAAPINPTVMHHNGANITKNRSPNNRLPIIRRTTERWRLLPTILDCSILHLSGNSV
jgi:hypothetical protein